MSSKLGSDSSDDSEEELETLPEGEEVHKLKRKTAPLDKKKVKESNKLDKIDTTACHWNPANGQMYFDDEVTNPTFPFTQLDTVFNDKNIWINIQPMSEVPKCDLDFDDEENWVPFINSKYVIASYGVIANAFDPPILQMKPSSTVDEQRTLELVSDLVDAIGNYRRNTCFISTTKFHRDISKYLQGIYYIYVSVYLKGEDGD